MNTDIKPLLKVTIFSDYICPYCYLGWLRLEKLRNEYDLRVNWCMTEIHSDNPATGRPATELGYRHGQWERMVAELHDLASAEGVRFSELNMTTNSHHALLLAEAAKELGAAAFYALHRRLFESYLCEGHNLGDTQLLRELITTLNLDPDLPNRAWTDARYEQLLQEVARAARELGISATPTFFFNEQPLRGLQTDETLRLAAQAAVSANGKSH